MTDISMNDGDTYSYSAELLAKRTREWTGGAALSLDRRGPRRTHRVRAPPVAPRHCAARGRRQHAACGAPQWRRAADERLLAGPGHAGAGASRHRRLVGLPAGFPPCRRAARHDHGRRAAGRREPAPLARLRLPARYRRRRDRQPHARIADGARQSRPARAALCREPVLRDRGPRRADAGRGAADHRARRADAQAAAHGQGVYRGPISSTRSRCRTWRRSPASAMHISAAPSTPRWAWRRTSTSCGGASTWRRNCWPTASCRSRRSRRPSASATRAT